MQGTVQSCRPLKDLRQTECQRFEVLEAVGVRPFRIRLQVLARICRDCANNALATGKHNVPVHKLTAAGMAEEEKKPA